MHIRRVLATVALPFLLQSQVANAQPNWHWEFAPDVIEMPFEGLIQSTFTNEDSFAELHLFGAGVHLLPNDGHFYIPELDTTVVFTSLPVDQVLLPGQTVTLALYSMVLFNQNAHALKSAAYVLTPEYSARYGIGCANPAASTCESLTTLSPTTPLTLSISAVPEPDALALSLVGLLWLNSVRLWRRARQTPTS